MRVMHAVNVGARDSRSEAYAQACRTSAANCNIGKLNAVQLPNLSILDLLELGGPKKHLHYGSRT